MEIKGIGLNLIEESSRSIEESSDVDGRGIR